MPDPNYNDVSLLLHFNGVAGATTYTDNSPRTKVPVNQGAAQLEVTQVKFGSAALDATSATFSRVNITPDVDFNFGTGDFTIEFWAYPTQNLGPTSLAMFQYGGYFVGGDDGFTIVWYNGTLDAYLTHAGSSLTNDFSSDPTALNAWYAVALVRSAGVTSIYKDGISIGSIADTRNYSTANGLFIGGGQLSGADSYPSRSFIDELRITKGVARYTSNYTPDTSPFPDSGTPTVPTVIVTPPTNPTIRPRPKNQFQLVEISDTDTAPYTGGTMANPVFCRATLSGLDVLLVSRSPGGSPDFGGYNVGNLKTPVKLWKFLQVEIARGASFIWAMFTHANDIYIVSDKSIEYYQSIAPGNVIWSTTFIDLTMYDVADAVKVGNAIYVLANIGNAAHLLKYDVSAGGLPVFVSDLDLLTTTASGANIMAYDSASHNLVIQDLESATGWNFP